MSLAKNITPETSRFANFKAKAHAPRAADLVLETLHAIPGAWGLVWCAGGGSWWVEKWPNYERLPHLWLERTRGANSRFLSIFCSQSCTHVFLKLRVQNYRKRTDESVGDKEYESISEYDRWFGTARRCQPTHVHLQPLVVQPCAQKAPSEVEAADIATVATWPWSRWVQSSPIPLTVPSSLDQSCEILWEHASDRRAIVLGTVKFPHPGGNLYLPHEIRLNDSWGGQNNIRTARGMNRHGTCGLWLGTHRHLTPRCWTEASCMGYQNLHPRISLTKKQFWT